jgi:hypothetical protein
MSRENLQIPANHHLLGRTIAFTDRAQRELLLEAKTGPRLVGEN